MRGVHASREINMADQKTKVDGLDHIKALTRNVITARKELGKLRKDMKEMKHMFVKRFNNLELMLTQAQKNGDGNTVLEDLSLVENGLYSKKELGILVTFEREVNSKDVTCCSRVIGHIKTCFKEKNGIPRQGSVCPLSRGELVIDGVKEFTNPTHSLQGLEKFSHVWLLFIFHKNANNSVRAKVSPPRLDGKKVGVFASRSPHRPNPIGLTLAHLDAIQENKLFLSGLDILDGTPILDIKPYIPDYDCITYPSTSIEECSIKDWVNGRVAVVARQTDLLEDFTSNQGFSGSLTNALSLEGQEKETLDHSSSLHSASISDWIRKPPIPSLTVTYSKEAEENLQKFSRKNDDCDRDASYELEFLADSKEVQKLIGQILKEDPRSIHRRHNCANEIYYFTVDKVNVSCVFNGNTVQVINVEPI